MPSEILVGEALKGSYRIQSRVGEALKRCYKIQNTESRIQNTEGCIGIGQTDRVVPKRLFLCASSNGHHA